MQFPTSVIELAFFTPEEGGSGKGMQAEFPFTLLLSPELGESGLYEQEG